ncbi:MAG: hypothetical protein ACNA7J_10810, partial [Wenzhouxiangella sp.]
LALFRALVKLTGFFLELAHIAAEVCLQGFSALMPLEFFPDGLQFLFGGFHACRDFQQELIFHHVDAPPDIDPFSG